MQTHKVKFQVNKSFFYVLFLFTLGLQDSYSQSHAPKLSPDKKLTQYILNQWGTDEGLPSTNVRRIVQTQNGYLWLAGFDGLTSFDGVRFTNYNKSNIKGFTTNIVQVLQEAPDGTLWIGTHGSGLFRYKNSKFEKIGLDTVLISSIHFENDKEYLVSGRGVGLLQLNPSTKQIKALNIPELKGTTVYKMVKDKKNQLWLATDNKGLICKKGNTYTSYTVADGLPSNTILEIFFDHQQVLWVGTVQGLAYLKNGKFIPLKEFEKSIVHKIIQDKSKSYWIATSMGLHRKNHYKQIIERFPENHSASKNNVLDLHLDPEGSLWIATYRDGLFRLKDGKFTNYTQEDGLSTASVGSICEYKPGTFLIGMNDGVVNQITGNEITEFVFKADIPRVRVFNIFKDSQQNVWIATFNGALKISPKGTETFYNKEKGLSDNAVRVIFEDTQGNIWLGTRAGGVTIITPKGNLEILNQKNGLSSNFIMSINADQQGNIWIGTNDGGVNVVSPKGKITAYTLEQGLVSNLVFNTYTDNEGITWIVTNGGISRFEKGKFFNFTSQEGLQNDSPFDIIEDKKGQFWLPNSRGIIKISKQQLNNYALGKLNKLDWEVYDRQDGMKSEDCTGAAHSLKDSQGRIWVPTNGGVVVIDPEHLPKNFIPPALSINSLLVDNQPVDIHAPILLEAGSRRLVFDYSALSLLASSKVKFKYKLIGFDTEWIDAQKERQAVYTNLPPGNYTFQVIAANNDGIWNEKGTTLSFRLKPFFYQTNEFYVFLAFLSVLLVYLIIRWRVYYLQQKRKELEVIVARKTKEISQKTEILEQQTLTLSEQKQLLEKKNNNITQSITYAKRIQDAMLPPLAEIKAVLPDSFVLFKPRDIVSGDFYWLAELEPQPIYEELITSRGTQSVLKEMTNHKTLIAAIDCTGHGVPGAFMSMIGNDLLNEIVGSKKITEADKILSELHTMIIQTLKQQNNANQDGMDLTLCVINHDEKYIDFAGAKNSLLCIQHGNLEIIRGDKLPIGGWTKRNETHRTFSKHRIPLVEGACFYMFSDGFQDQFGEESRKKFARHRIREMLLEVYQEDMETQKQLIAQTLEEWQGNETQTDDILVIGFRV